MPKYGTFVQSDVCRLLLVMNLMSTQSNSFLMVTALLLVPMTRVADFLIYELIQNFALILMNPSFVVSHLLTFQCQVVCYLVAMMTTTAMSGTRSRVNESVFLQLTKTEYLVLVSQQMAWLFALVVGMQLCVSGLKSCSITVFSMLSLQCLSSSSSLFSFAIVFNSSCSVLSTFFFFSFCPPPSISLSLSSFLILDLYIYNPQQQYPSKKVHHKTKSQSYYYIYKCSSYTIARCLFLCEATIWVKSAIGL